MKLFSMCWMIAAAASLTAAQNSANDVRLPEEIAEFYRSYNSISALSTTEERAQAAAIADTQDQELTPRLRQILALMQQTERRIMESDRGIVSPTGPSVNRWFSDEVLDIKRVRADLDRLFIEVTSRPVSRDQQQIVIVDVDHQVKPDVCAAAQRAVGKIIKPACPSTTQIHQWVRRGDTWFVMDVKIQKTTDSAQPSAAQVRTADW